MAIAIMSFPKCGEYFSEYGSEILTYENLRGEYLIGQLALILGVLLVMRSKASAPEVPQSGFDNSVSTRNLRASLGRMEYHTR